MRRKSAGNGGCVGPACEVEAGQGEHQVEPGPIEPPAHHANQPEEADQPHQHLVNNCKVIVGFSC